VSFQRFRSWQQGEFVICFVDTAAGGGDNVAGQFLSHKWLDVPEVFHAPVTITYATPLFHERLTQISRETGVQPIVAFERNNGGGFEMDRLARLNRYGDYRIYSMKQLGPDGKMLDTGKLGWDTNLATRPKMCQDLKAAVEGELVHLYHRQTVNEMFSFVIKPNGRYEAEQNAHDDLVMALAGAWQLYQTEGPIDDSQESAVVETMSLGAQYKEAGVLMAKDYLR
jgi:hypothetical protein